MVEEKVRKELPDKYQRIILVVLILAIVAIAIELIFIFRNEYFVNMLYGGPSQTIGTDVEIPMAEYLQTYNETGSVEEALKVIDNEVATASDAKEAFHINRQRIDLLIISENYQDVIDFYQTVDVNQITDEQRLFLYQCVSYAYQEMGNEDMMWQFYNKAEDLRIKMEEAAQ